VLQLFNIAARNLAQRTRRTLMLGGVTAAVTALLVLLSGLTAGVRTVLLRTGMVLSTGQVNVAGLFKVSPGQVSSVLSHAPRVQEIVRSAVPELEYVVERGRGYVNLISDNRSIKTDVTATDLRVEPRLREVLRIKDGSLDAFAEPGTMVLFEDHARRLKVKAGDQLTVLTTTYRGSHNTVDVRVAAIAQNMGMESTVTAFIHLETWRQLYLVRKDSVSVLHLYLKDINAAAEVKTRLREKLHAAGYQLWPVEEPKIWWMKLIPASQQDWTGQKLDVTTWEDDQAMLGFLVKGLTALSMVLIFFLLALISVGTTNTQWIAIRERTREIGALRAIGMSRFRVLAMFLAEGFLLGVASTVVGAVLGAVLGAIINGAQIPLPSGAQLLLMSEHLYFQVEFGTVLFSAVFITVALTLISLIPAFLAARLKPVTAFSHA
jgi:ABC-type lipoprotein release transport system permease subunit